MSDFSSQRCLVLSPLPMHFVFYYYYYYQEVFQTEALTAGDIMYITMLTSSLLILDTIRKIMAARGNGSGGGSGGRDVEGQIMEAFTKIGAKITGNRIRRKSYSPVPTEADAEASIV